ncbi:hypothetical protein [Immundisolibacter cernigliae]|uniref:Uncharacterized protein n=1 Tax=Immundisolibacter cernigliae TaxID=1810504 RepID=A0A1B1YRL0_9GAMM|nr:hypothetical protein [Immundisolibacter cernigliae]ANX03424.1 hypothetical protein PG2T_03945 [Immundisolibacter cernigliae]
MLSTKDNERLTRIGPGTPAGELLRRYWQALCPVADLYPDVEADRRLRADLDTGAWTRWGELTRQTIEDAGQHEVLNWICLAGAMAAIGHHARVVDFVESWVFNSSKCFALFAPA